MVNYLSNEQLLTLLEAQGVRIRVSEEVGERGCTALLFALFPWLILFGFFYWIYSRTSEALGGRLGGPSEGAPSLGGT